MEERYSLRITRYRGEDSYEQIVDFLARLFPERGREELASGLALTPVLVTHEATLDAVEALRDALTDLGATVRVAPVDSGEPSFESIEIGQDFLDRGRQRRRSETSVDTASGDDVRPPWEQD